MFFLDLNSRLIRRWLQSCILFPVLSLGLSLFSLSALYAETSTEKAQRYFKIGNQAYQNGQYPQALDALEKAYQSFPLPLMLLNIGDTYAKMDQYPQARERYASFVRTGQDRDGSGAKKLKAIEKKLQSWIPVRITSKPSGARVFIDHLDYPAWGVTPFTTQLPPKTKINLHFQKEGYEPFHSIQTLTRSNPSSTSSGSLQSISAHLKGKPAYLTVLGQPQNLTIRLPNQTEVTGLPQTLNLGVGQFEIELYAPHHLPEKKSITLTPLHTQKAPLTLEVRLKSSKGLGLFTLQVDQKETLILIDGDPAGETPMTNPLELSEGEHTLELRGKKGERHQQTFKIKKGQTTSLKIKLTQTSFLTRSSVATSLMILGGSTLVGALVSGGLAWSSMGDLETCRTSFQCHRNQGELNLAQEVRGYSQAADLLMLSGVLFGSIGAYLYWSTPESKSKTMNLKVTPLPNGAALWGTF